MIVLMDLLEKNDLYVIYSYGYDENNLDGRIKLYLNDHMKYEILKESEDEHIGKIGTMKAITKLINAIKKNELKDKMSYQS